MIGVTARQRVQTYDKQKRLRPDVSCLRWWCSPAPLQGFEFEATFILNTALFNLVGALPVLPGPCQVLRWSDFAHTVAPSYMESMHADREKDDMIVVQTRLAEDRVMSTGCIVLGDFSTEWVVGSTFYYEPELKFSSGLLPQRRRWMNGTLAAFIYLVRDDVLVSANARHKPNQTGHRSALMLGLHYLLTKAIALVSPSPSLCCCRCMWSARSRSCGR